MNTVIDDTDKIGAPREFGDAVAQLQGGGPQVVRQAMVTDGIQVTNRAPFFTVNLPDSTGTPRYFDVVHKKAMWMVPAAELAHRATQVCVRPGRKTNNWRPKPNKPDEEAPMNDGKVLVIDKDGRQLARFPNVETAHEKLTEAGVDYSRLIGGDVLVQCLKGPECKARLAARKKAA